MEFIKRIEGAVFFVDILGFGALTQNQISLNKTHFSPWLRKYHHKLDNQVLAAAILSEFREILLNINNEYKNITISQLSDCAFIWSDNVVEVILASNNIMSQCISTGILCRGGLSFGEIIETTKSNSLGRFILGKAVTDAVKLETISKGCRIMITPEFPGALYEYRKEFSKKIYPLFQPFINPLDYITYDEFKWYLVPFMNKNVEELPISGDETRRANTVERLMLATSLRLNPKFYWNAASNQGLLQLKASVNFLSESNDPVFKIKHNFDWKDVIEKRSLASVQNFRRKLEREIIDGIIED